MYRLCMCYENYNYKYMKYKNYHKIKYNAKYILDEGKQYKNSLYLCMCFWNVTVYFSKF